MLEFLKKQRAGFYLNIVLFVMTLISLILFAMNSSLALFSAVASINGGIYACLILSLVALLASIGLGAAPILKESKQLALKETIIDVLRIIICILLAIATVVFVGGRIENLGYYFGSDLYLGNSQAIAAVMQALACIIIFAITWVISLISVFFTQAKEQ